MPDEQTAACARELEMAGTAELAGQMAALLEPAAETADWRTRLEEQCEQLQMLAEQELEARMAAAAPAAPGGIAAATAARIATRREQCPSAAMPPAPTIRPTIMVTASNSDKV